MKVFVTGGSGFVGSHVIAALADAGHEAIAYVRDPAKLQRALALHGEPPAHVVHGTITDGQAVRRGLREADAVIHSAAVFSWDGRRAGDMRRANVEGTRLVLEAAARKGCNPIVHVSTVTVLWPHDAMASVDGPDDPQLGTSPFPYARTKREAEVIARDLQAQGHPVLIAYPGGIYGPVDPGPGEQAYVLRNLLGNRFPMRIPDGRMLVIDVRWIARAIVALLGAGQRAPRVLMGGHCLTWSEYFGVLRCVTGRRLPHVLPMTRSITWLSGLLASMLQRIVPIRLPLSHEMAMNVYGAGPTDDRIAEALAGPKPSPQDTLRDAIRWLVQQGHLPAKHAGRLTPGGDPKAIAEPGA